MPAVPFLVAVATLAVCVQGGAWAQSKTPPPPIRLDVGKVEFESKCAVCHGRSGRGQGPYTEFLTKSPPDLTGLARANGGILPMDRLYQVISGDGLPAHGPSDMPVWGREYRMEAANHYLDVPYDEQRYVRAKLLALLEYLNRLQQK